MSVEYKNIIEAGTLIQVKKYLGGEPKLGSTEDVHNWFEEEKKQGYQFLKAFIENEQRCTLFVKTEDFEKIINNLK